MNRVSWVSLALGNINAFLTRMSFHRFCSFSMKTLGTFWSLPEPHWTMLDDEQHSSPSNAQDPGNSGVIK